MIQVDELVDESQYSGVSWLGARLANTVVYRPSPVCIVNRTDQEIKRAKFRNKMAQEKLDNEIKKETVRFGQLVKKNKDGRKIRAVARLIDKKERGSVKLERSGERLEEAHQQLQELKLLQDESKVQKRLTTIISHMAKDYHRRGVEQAGIKYEIEKDRIDAIHAMYQESWSGDGEGDGDGTTVEGDTILVKRIMHQNNIDPPPDPVYMSEFPLLDRSNFDRSGKGKTCQGMDPGDAELFRRYERVSQ